MGYMEHIWRDMTEGTGTEGLKRVNNVPDNVSNVYFHDESNMYPKRVSKYVVS